MRVSTYPTIWGKMKRYITFLNPYRKVILCIFMHDFIFFHDRKQCHETFGAKTSEFCRFIIFTEILKVQL